MDMDKICTILLLLALMVIICRNSSELGIEGYDVEQKKEELIKDIDEDAEDVLDIVDDIIDEANIDVENEEVPEAPVVPEAPDITDIPEAPDIPDIPDIPEAPDVMDLPELQEVVQEVIEEPPPPPQVEPTPVPVDPVPPPPAPQPTPPAPQPTPPAPQPTPPAPVPQQVARPAQQAGSPLLRLNNQGPITAYDSSFTSYAGAAAVYGEQIPLSMQQEYLTLKSLGKVTPQMMQNIERASVPPLQDSQVPRFDPTSAGGLLPPQFPGMASGTQPQAGQQQAQPSSTKNIEVHFVFAEWCGHSQRAVPEFKKLVQDNSVSTSSGEPVTFIMTEESDPGMAQFKGKVQGFPTYMVVAKENGNVLNISELQINNRSSDGIKEAVSNL